MTAFQDGSDPLRQGQTLLSIGRVLRDRGDHSGAASALEQALALATRHHLRRLEGDVRNALAPVYHQTGSTGRALKELHLSLDIRRDLADPAAQASTMNNLGALYTDLGDYARALDYHLSALRLLDPSGPDRTAARCRANVGRLYMLLGQPQAGEPHYREALKAFQALGDLHGEAMMTANLSETLTRLGDAPAALHFAQRALAAAEQFGFVQIRTLALTALGEVHVVLGDAPAAQVAFEQALGAARTEHDTDAQIQALLDLAGVHGSLGRPDLAAAEYDEALTVALCSGRKPAQLRVLERRAAFDAQQGQHAAAYAHLTTARELDGQIRSEQNERQLRNVELQYELDLARQKAEVDRALKDAALIAQADAEAQVQDRTRELERLALYDALTGLPNRVLFRDRLTVTLAQAASISGQVAVGVLDLDRFKNINDTLGHTAGDELLASVAARLCEVLPASTTVARMGGDEFLLIVPGAGHADLEQTAWLVTSAFTAPFVLHGQTVVVRPSLGFAVSPDHACEPDGLLRRADLAMYEAKRDRLEFAVFRDALEPAPSSTLTLEAALHGALARQELELHYQPLFRTSDRVMIAKEALLRWRHPELGLISPAQFIPLAEESGLIVAIGTWVLQQACRQAATWPGVRVAVNISARQFSRPDFLAVVERALACSGLEPARLEIELTESMLMRSPDAAAELLRSLKALGIRIAIDDFGTGYSSLAYLKRFPLDTLKVDQSFVRDIAQASQDTAIVTTIIHMAHALGLEVTGEGVETEEQWAFLRDHACDSVQGYLLGRPAPE
ncbi:diguanylate cyclase (GGDEF)-like protein [Deinococcus soli (ex Cha et al. 2016)]|nr:diguanylate cyclase (GGDEF)-like protein [Deinococcus soli (ex Cha et al. 2016)]MDR6751380.1 diguanylate cyclase (GGDEF)-like protein [Deinococcus soli (ex Cha et al. 2016)]